MNSMFGPIAIIIVLVVGIPVGVMVSGALGAAVLGFFLQSEVEHNFEGSEHLETNR